MLLYNVIISWFAGIWIEALRMQSDVRIITPTAVVALFGMPASALAQDPGTQVIGTAMLPRDLSPWGMYLSADPVVKAVLIGLRFESIVTWTVWLAKSLEIFLARRRVRAGLDALANASSIEEAVAHMSHT